MPKNSSLVRKLRQLAEAAGLQVVEMGHPGSGHIQVQGGPMLVNWYPYSAKRTAYVSATRRGVANATPEQVIAMAGQPPKFQPGQIERNRGKAQRAKRRLLKSHPFCRWCSCELTKETATLEHIIPLARGGLDHHNNMALACRPCNESRGHDMPELEEAAHVRG